ncbi:MAG: Asp/Glu racemase, partial [Hyphomicrobiaceae bacterium]
NETFRAGIGVIGDNVMAAVDSAMTAEPDYLVMGISALSFFGGAKGADAFVAAFELRSDRRVTVGSHAMTAALQAYGNLRRLGLLTPYWPVMNTEVKRYLGDMGFEVVRDVALECRSWVGIAHVTTEQCRNALRHLDGDDVDALVQVGTNLSMVRLAAAAELWLGKPVIAINTATYWHALRANGISEQVSGFGQLLERH